jgi:uncharacterized protein GlcG (DUF336 family)
MPIKAMGISLEQARAVIQAGQAEALEIGVPMNIALVDAGANLVALAFQKRVSTDVVEARVHLSVSFA